VAAPLPGLDPAIGAYTKVQFVDAQVKQAIAEEFARHSEKAKKAKLTWTTPADGWAKRGARGFVGKPVGPDGFDERLPWMSYEGVYFVQNCRYYLSNGSLITEDKIPGEPIPRHLCAICQHRPLPCSIREIMQRQMAAYRKQALELDAMLCKYCYEHTSSTPDEYAEHLASAHPDKLGQRLGLGIATPPPSPSSGSSFPPGGATATTPPLPPPSFTVPVGASTSPAAAANAAVTLNPFQQAAPIPVSTYKPDFSEKNMEGVMLLCNVEKDGKPCGRDFRRKADLKRHQTTTHKRG
jgi:hypothetical protein